MGEMADGRFLGNGTYIRFVWELNIDRNNKFFAEVKYNVNK